MKGWHQATVETCVLKDSAKGGKYWNVRLTTDCDKTIFHMYVWENANAEVQNRSRAQFADFAVACGVTGADSEEDLSFGVTGKQIYILVDHKKNNLTDEMQATVKEVADLAKQHRRKGTLTIEVASQDAKEEGLPF